MPRAMPPLFRRTIRTCCIILRSYRTHLPFSSVCVSCGIAICPHLLSIVSLFRNDTGTNQKAHNSTYKHADTECNRCRCCYLLHPLCPFQKNPKCDICSIQPPQTLTIRRSKQRALRRTGRGFSCLAPFCLYHCFLCLNIANAISKREM